MAEETLPELAPEQVRPEGKGRGPHKRQVALKGGCWLVLGPEGCEALGSNGQLFKGQCYVPVLARARHPATSDPARSP
jgi:eukaryotic-like serine/threonine-protein kinase